MKTGVRPRADDWDDYWFPSLGQGSVHDLSPDDPDQETVAVLVVPDPEQRHGWREFYVRREKPGQKREPMGFKPNRRNGQ